MFDMDQILAMEHAFLLAMAAGYAFDAPSRLEESTGARLIEFSDNDFIVQDRWWNGDDGYSHGTTLLRTNGKVRWAMSYCGPFQPESIPCLKAALQYQYRLGKFHGGRGPNTFAHGEYLYHNMPDGLGTFQKFSGIEVVTLRGRSRPVGSYRYLGGLLGGYQS